MDSHIVLHSFLTHHLTCGCSIMDAVKLYNDYRIDSGPATNGVIRQALHKKESRDHSTGVLWDVSVLSCSTSEAATYTVTTKIVVNYNDTSKGHIGKFWEPKSAFFPSRLFGIQTILGSHSTKTADGPCASLDITTTLYHYSFGMFGSFILYFGGHVVFRGRLFNLANYCRGRCHCNALFLLLSSTWTRLMVTL